LTYAGRETAAQAAALRREMEDIRRLLQAVPSVTPAVPEQTVPERPIPAVPTLPITPITPPPPVGFAVAGAGAAQGSLGTCGVCLSPLHSILHRHTANLAMLRRCGHVYCGTCLHQTRQYGPNRCAMCRAAYYAADIVTLEPDYTSDGAAIICHGCHEPQPVPPSVVSAMPCGHVFCATCAAARPGPRSVCGARVLRPNGTEMVCGRTGTACLARLG